MSRVVIAGVGMTPFGRFPGRGVRALSIAAIDEALADAGIPQADVAQIFFGNAAAGVISEQEMIRGQVALRHHGLGHTPLINVENACASGGSALNLGYHAVASGQCEVVLVVGVVKLLLHFRLPICKLVLIMAAAVGKAVCLCSSSQMSQQGQLSTSQLEMVD